MGKPTNSPLGLGRVKPKAPVTFAQAARFCGQVETIFKEFDIGVSRRVMIDTRIGVYADVYKTALVRNSSPDVCEFLEKKYKDAILELDKFVAGPLAVSS